MMPARGRIGARSSLPFGLAGLRGVPKIEAGRITTGKTSPFGPKGSSKYTAQRTQPATNIENKLRYSLLRKGINFVEQASIGPWSIDFLLPDYMACVEADGEFWHSSTQAKMKDRRKDAWLRSKGYIVFHFDGKEIHQDADYCVERMMKSIDAQMENIAKEVQAVQKKQSDPKKASVNDDYEQWLKG